MDNTIQRLRPENVYFALGTVDWKVARQTFGSSHATWIGLLVKWWVDLNPESHWVLDGAPSFATGRAGQGDAILCDSNGPAGVLEVEGSVPIVKIRTIEQYFKKRRPELRSIWFGILLVYSYTPFGTGANRNYPPADDPSVLDAAREASARNPGCTIIVLFLDKTFARHNGVRGISEYYSGTLTKVSGVLFTGGKEIQRSVLFHYPSL